MSVTVGLPTHQTSLYLCLPPRCLEGETIHPLVISCSQSGLTSFLVGVVRCRRMLGAAGMALDTTDTVTVETLTLMETDAFG